MKYVFAILSSLSLTACTGLGMVTTETKQFSTTQTLQLASRPSNFVDIVVATGKSLGYTYTGGDRSKNIVTFSDNGKIGLGSLIGQGRQLSLQVSMLPNGRTVKFDVLATANYSQANEEKINKRIGQFKDALRQRL